MSDRSSWWPTRERAQEVASCVCGSAWFTLAAGEVDGGQAVGAVSLDGEGAVIGYSGVPRCLECGQRWEPAGSYLRVVQ